MSEKDKIACLKEAMVANNLLDNRCAIEEIQPRGKATPFLKLTFLTATERWTFTHAMNTTKRHIIS